MERMSQDVALSILNTLRVNCMKAMTSKNLSPEQRKEYEERNNLLAYEEMVVYGMEGDSYTEDIVYDKIDRYYSPEVKAYYGKA